MKDQDPYRPTEAELMEMTREEFAAHSLEVAAITRSLAATMIDSCEDALEFRRARGGKDLKLSRFMELSLLSAYDEHSEDERLRARIEALIRAYELQYVPGTNYHLLSRELLIVKGYDPKTDLDCLSDEEVDQLTHDSE